MNDHSFRHYFPLILDSAFLYFCAAVFSLFPGIVFRKTGTAAPGESLRPVFSGCLKVTEIRYGRRDDCYEYADKYEFVIKLYSFCDIEPFSKRL